jgi:hypothetical protein
MEVRNLKIIFNKSGQGYVSGKLSIPISWLNDMGLTPEDREVEVKYDKKSKSFTGKKITK